MVEGIYEKLNSIKNLDDKLLLKKVLNAVFTSLYECSEKKYKALEDRVFNESDTLSWNYSIYCTIAKKQEVDSTDEFLFPILQEDVEEKIYDTKDILKRLKDNKPITMFNVFMKCDYLLLKKLFAANKQFKGVIVTDKRSHEANFSICSTKRYWLEIMALHDTFIDNNIPWATVNNPYISKIASVTLVNCEDQLSSEEKIMKITVDFGECSEYVEYDIVPLWNIKKLVLQGAAFPMPCEDKINYEHLISLQKEGAANGYLVEDHKGLVRYVTRRNNILDICANVLEAQRWTILKVTVPLEETYGRYSYQITSNAKLESYMSKTVTKISIAIKTKAELIRLINSLDLKGRLEFKSFELKDAVHDDICETYDMNYFIADEIRETNIKRVLLLFFKPINNKDYLIRDLLSFAVSEVQLFYPEYKCEGRLI